MDKNLHLKTWGGGGPVSCNNKSIDGECKSPSDAKCHCYAKCKDGYHGAFIPQAEDPMLGPEGGFRDEVNYRCTVDPDKGTGVLKPVDGKPINCQKVDSAAVNA